MNLLTVPPTRRWNRPAAAHWLPITLLSVVLMGCSQKPPECSDPQVAGVFKSIVVERLSTDTNSLREMFLSHRDGYLKRLKLELKDIVSDGYDSSARKNRCAGTVTFESASGVTGSSRSAFTVQLTSDGSGRFLVEADQIQTITRNLVGDFTRYAMEQVGKQEQATGVAAAATPSQSPASGESGSVQPPPMGYSTAQSQADTLQMSAQSRAETATTQPVSQATAAVATAPAPAAPAPAQVVPIPSTLPTPPSFDCAKAASSAEKLICATPALATR